TLAVGTTAWQRHDADFALHRAVLALRQGPSIRPIPHENRIARLENAPRRLLIVAQHAGRGDFADPTLRERQSLDGTRIVHRYVACRVDDRAAAERVDPFERIAGQTFIGLA